MGHNNYFCPDFGNYFLFFNRERTKKRNALKLSQSFNNCHYDYDKKLNGSIVAICGDYKERHIRKLAINKNKIYLRAINPDFDSFLIEGNHKYKKFKTNRITKEDYDIAEKTGDWRIIGYVISILTENIIHDVFLLFLNINEILISGAKSEQRRYLPIPIS